jgi:hypothetical protein
MSTTISVPDSHAVKTVKSTNENLCSKIASDLDSTYLDGGINESELVKNRNGKPKTYRKRIGGFIPLPGTMKIEQPILPPVKQEAEAIFSDMGTCTHSCKNCGMCLSQDSVDLVRTNGKPYYKCNACICSVKIIGKGRFAHRMSGDEYSEVFDVNNEQVISDAPPHILTSTNVSLETKENIVIENVSPRILREPTPVELCTRSTSVNSPKFTFKYQNIVGKIWDIFLVVFFFFAPYGKILKLIYSIYKTWTKKDFVSDAKLTCVADDLEDKLILRQDKIEFDVKDENKMLSGPIIDDGIIKLMLPKNCSRFTKHEILVHTMIDGQIFDHRPLTNRNVNICPEDYKLCLIKADNGNVLFKWVKFMFALMVDSFALSCCFYLQQNDYMNFFIFMLSLLCCLNYLFYRHRFYDVRRINMQLFVLPHLLVILNQAIPMRHRAVLDDNYEIALRSCVNNNLNRVPSLNVLDYEYKNIIEGTREYFIKEHMQNLNMGWAMS